MRDGNIRPFFGFHVGFAFAVLGAKAFMAPPRSCHDDATHEP